MSEEQPGDATERTDNSEDDCDEPLPPCITSNEAAATVAGATGKKQMFTKSLAHRDDWLHRGIMLRNIDYYKYSRGVERVTSFMCQYVDGVKPPGFGHLLSRSPKRTARFAILETKK